MQQLNFSKHFVKIKNMNKKKSVLISLLVFIGIVFVMTNVSYAAESNVVKILGTDVDAGSIQGFVGLAVAFSKWMLGIVGSLSLLMFVYGGFMMLISQGESSKISAAKTIITNAVIGLVIVFGSFAFIQYFMKTMGFEWKGTTAYIQGIK